MLTAQLEDRFRDALGSASAGREGSVRFAVDFVRLLARVLPDEVNEGALTAMRDALRARSDLSKAEVDTLLEMALAPEHRSTVDPAEIRAFGARFGGAEEEALRAALTEEMHLERFAQEYGPAEALLLLDSLFAVCAEDGVIDPSEIARLQRSAEELGIDPMLVGALFRKHDARHATGDFRFDLDKDRLLIGRSLSADIQLPDPQVAVRHAELVRDAGGWRVVDLASGRPTLLNGSATRSAPLRPGDELRVGPYTLVLNRESTTLTAYGLKSFSALSVRNLKRQIGEVSLLDDVSFTVFSGEVIALVGPSGAGKTTLLTAIAGIAPADTGDVLLDGNNFHSLLANDRSIVGIVPQDDVVHSELSVEEALWYSGRLRFAKDVPSESIDTAVDRVLEDLTIDHIRSSRIGDAVKRGISGGQRKRVSLGQELLTHSTKVLFLDEPTSGLDPQTAQDIVGLVRHLADEGRIIFIVTHDVTPSVMSMVDHLIVMAPGGRLAWFGPPDDACNYFKVDSPDEIFARLQDRSGQAWGVDYKQGEARKKYVATREYLIGIDGVESGESEDAEPVRMSPWLQLRTLTARYAKVKLRDRVGTGVLLAQAPLLAVAMWLIFEAPTSSQLFMLGLSALWFGASASVRELISERSIWQRERRVGLGVLPYVGSKVAVLGGLVAVQCLVLSFLNWWLVGMGDDPYNFSLTMLSISTVLTGLTGVSLGLLMSALFSSSEAAVGALPLVLIPKIAFGGLIVGLKEMKVALAYQLSHLMYTRYAFETLIFSGSNVSAPSLRGADEITAKGAAAAVAFGQETINNVSGEPEARFHPTLSVYNWLIGILERFEVYPYTQLGGVKVQYYLYWLVPNLYLLLFAGLMLAVTVWLTDRAARN